MAMLRRMVIHLVLYATGYFVLKGIGVTEFVWIYCGGVVTGMLIESIAWTNKGA